MSAKDSLSPDFIPFYSTCLAGSDSTDEDDEIYVRAPLCEEMIMSLMY